MPAALQEVGYDKNWCFWSIKDGADKYWFNRSVEEEIHHPLILIGIFIVVFLAIHPFKDGNGWLSRVLTTLLLLRAGYGYVLYSSMESCPPQKSDLRLSSDSFECVFMVKPTQNGH